MADRVQVMYGGRVVEEGTADDILDRARSTRTPQGLLASIPRLDRPRPRRLPSIAGTPAAAGQVRSGLRVRRPLRRTASSPATVQPALLEVPDAGAPGPRPHRAACHLTRGRGAPRDRHPYADRRDGPARPGPGQSTWSSTSPHRAGGCATGPWCTPSTASASRSAPARRSGWSASRAAASRPSAGASSGSPTLTSGHGRGRRHRHLRRCPRRRAAPAAHGHADGVPGPVRLAQPPPARRRRASG